MGRGKKDFHVGVYGGCVGRGKGIFMLGFMAVVRREGKGYSHWGLWQLCREGEAERIFPKLLKIYLTIRSTTQTRQEKGFSSSS